MKICFVGPADSAHIIKWCNWFSSHGHKVYVISFTRIHIKGTKVFYIDPKVSPNDNDFNKIKYLFKGKTIKRIIDKINPDIINVHYATSYGVAIALAGVNNYILSVWGSDIYDFPKKSPLHKALLKYSLKKARYLFSTSQAMADEASKYTDKKFEITPFGVDMNLFNPNKRTRNIDAKPFVFGTVKTLSDLYGIKYILEAAYFLKEKHPELNIAVRIAGDGKQVAEYKELVNQLGIKDITTFLGRITQEQAATEWANMDVAVIPSILYESFGVSAVEAQASGTPVIISDVAGLLETTLPNVSSDVVPTENARAIAGSLFKLYSDTELRREMGIAGRNNVVSRFELNKCFNEIEQKYSTILKAKGTNF